MNPKIAEIHARMRKRGNERRLMEQATDGAELIALISQEQSEAAARMEQQTDRLVKQTDRLVDFTKGLYWFTVALLVLGVIQLIVAFISRP